MTPWTVQSVSVWWSIICFRLGRRDRRDEDKDGKKDEREKRFGKDKEEKKEEEKPAERKPKGLIFEYILNDVWFLPLYSHILSSFPSSPAPENPLTMKTGGAYMPPHKLRELQAGIMDKSTEQYQRITWNALKKSLNGLVNKVHLEQFSIYWQKLGTANCIVIDNKLDQHN